MLLTLIVWALVLSSFALYLSGFFVPEIQRKKDPILSGLLFAYGLALGFNANQIHGGLLMGQAAGATGVLWLGWQALQLRWQAIPPGQRTPLPDLRQLQDRLQTFWQRVTTPTPTLTPISTVISDEPKEPKETDETVMSQIPDTLQKEEIREPNNESPPNLDQATLAAVAKELLENS